MYKKIAVILQRIFANYCYGKQNSYLIASSHLRELQGAERA